MESLVVAVMVIGPHLAVADRMAGSECCALGLRLPWGLTAALQRL